MGLTSQRRDEEASRQGASGRVLPPGPARDLVDRFRLLRLRRPLSVRLVAGRAGLSAGYVSEVLNGVKAPRPDAAARIARALGADDRSVAEVSRLAEEWAELQRFRHRAARERQRAGVPVLPGSNLVEDPRRPVQARPERYTIAQPDGPQRHLVAVAGALYRSRGAEIWVNSENTDMVMSRPTEFTVSAIIRYWGARRDSAGRVVDDIVANELAAQARQQPSVAPGTAIVTGSGALAESHGVRNIIHVASVSGEPGAGFRQVYNIAACVTNVLIEADQLARAEPSVRTILFPLLGVGTGGGMVEPTVITMIDTVVDFLLDHPSTQLTSVQILGFNAAEWRTLTAALAADRRLTRTAD